jgi:hypothetical protein
MTLRFYKETTVPASLQPNAVYLIAPPAHPNYLEIYVTNSAGTASRRVPRVEDIEVLISTALATLNTGALIVDTIALRDELAATNGQTVLVLDASADATVSSGAATYIWRASASAWVKISEAESLDLSLAWASITGRPTAAPEAIDSAVAAAHSHTNKPQLDKINETAEGLLTYNGALPRIAFDTVNW